MAKQSTLVSGPDFQQVGAGDVQVLPSGGGNLVSLGQIAKQSVLNQSVSGRPPTLSDDSTQGYVVGNFWQYNGTVWQALDVTPSQATWQIFLGGDPLPGDSISQTGLVGIYGTKKLVAAYSGMCINVVRASDSTAKDIGFLSNGMLDEATLDAFTANTTCYIAIWYDQSGGTNNATGIAATAPTITPLDVCGNSRTVVFNGSVASSIGPAVTLLTLPSGVTGNTQNCSALMLNRYGSCSAAIICPIQLTGTSSLTVGFTITTREFFVERTGAYLVTNQSLVTPTTPQILGFVSPPSGQGGVKLIIGQTTTANSLALSSTFTGGTLGSAAIQSSSVGWYDMAGIAIYARAISAAEVTTLTGAFYKTFGVVSQTQNTLLFVGDSITSGTFSTLIQTYGRKALALLNSPVVGYVDGRFGDTLQDMTANFTYRYTVENNPNAKSNIMVIFAGTNDIASGASGAQTFVYLQQFCGLAKAYGNFILVSTMLPRESLTTQQQAEWVTYNGLIRANWKNFADGLVDVAANPVMGPMAATSNTNLYADGTHPTDLGYCYIAPIFANAINSLMV